MWNRQRKRIKVTPGITGLSRPIVHIDGAVWHLDVGSSHPGGGAPSKGSAVRRLKWYASWVQNVVRQFGLYPMWTQGNLREFAPSKKLLLYVEIHNDNVANNGGTFACLQFENYITIGPFVV